MAQPMWKVVRVSDSTSFHPEHGPVAAKRVEFVLADGTTSNLVIPYDQFNKDTVHAHINRAALDLIHVLSLEGPPIPEPPSYEYSPPTNEEY